MSHICFFSLLLRSFDIDGSKYEANVNTAFYTFPIDPVRTNVCYPTDANAVDLRVDGNGQLGSVNGNGGCRSVNGAKQDFVCNPTGPCLSYQSFNCRCDYNGQFGGNGVSGVTGAQAGQQIVSFNEGVCGTGQGNLQPSDYADAAACWYDTSEVEAMSKYSNGLLYIYSITYNFVYLTLFFTFTIR